MPYAGNADGTKHTEDIMENGKNIEKATRPEPRSVLLIDGRGE